MRAQLHIPDVLSWAGFDAALRGLQGIAEAEIAQGTIPPLYDSGVVYQREPLGAEHWLSPSGVLGKGSGDCEDLASWRAAELRVTGEDPDAQAIVVRTSPQTWHAVVARSDNSFEDPSAALGMRSAAGLASPVAFTLAPEANRDYRARVELVGFGHHDSHESVEGCPACALLGALDSAAQSDLGFLPFIAPVVDMFTQAAQAARPQLTMRAPAQSAPRPQAPRALPPPRANVEPIEPDTLDEGILRLARQLKRLARGEAHRRLARAKRRL